ncbi:MAG: glycosyltransferase, partial [Rhodospirillaceae bacterium]
LGGPEKALASLASALSQDNHEVTVVNRTPYSNMADGAYWVPMNDSNVPRSADVLISLRKPSLLGTIRNAERRMLWVTGAPEYLGAPANQKLWESFAPSLMFVNTYQARLYEGGLHKLVVPPAVRNAFFETTVDTSDLPEEEVVYAEQAVKAAERSKAPPPHAVVTTHPLQGLDWLLDVWVRLIHPRMPEARLSIYSVVLARGIHRGEVPEKMEAVFEQVKAAAEANVVVTDPRNDEGMADVYRTSRVHLYPGHASDYACWTLAESQATGLPAVTRRLGGVDERVANGQSGYIVPDDEAFANVTVQILKDDHVFANMSEAAADTARRRTWPMAARELANFIT